MVHRCQEGWEERESRQNRPDKSKKQQARSMIPVWPRPIRYLLLRPLIPHFQPIELVVTDNPFVLEPPYHDARCNTNGLGEGFNSPRTLQPVQFACAMMWDQMIGGEAIGLHFPFA